MLIRTSELTGAALDWAVAKCEGCTEKRLLNLDMWKYIRQQGVFRYSTDWSEGGPIIEREGIAIDCVRCDGCIDSWFAALPMICEEFYEGFGSTPLIAAMRCYVASRLGDEVEVPEELL